MDIETKQQVIDIFGNGNVYEASLALGLSANAVKHWPEILTKKQKFLVLGAAIALNLVEPKKVVWQRRIAESTGNAEPESGAVKVSAA